MKKLQLRSAAPFRASGLVLMLVAAASGSCEQFSHSCTEIGCVEGMLTPPTPNPAGFDAMDEPNPRHPR